MCQGENLKMWEFENLSIEATLKNQFSASKVQRHQNELLVYCK
jgi:hypothetical protein